MRDGIRGSSGGEEDKRDPSARHFADEPKDGVIILDGGSREETPKSHKLSVATIGRAKELYFNGIGSGIAAPSLRGSDAPKFTLLETFRNTAWPPPTSDA